jgi:hypothetical protein
MASYIASNAYLGKTYPSSILIAFGKREVENNRLNSEIEIEKSQEEIDQLQKELDHASGEKIKKENTQTNTKPEIFQKDVFRNNKLKDNKYQKADDHKIEVKEPRKSSSSKKSEK